jgi:hypothetical protein
VRLAAYELLEDGNRIEAVASAGHRLETAGVEQSFSSGARCEATGRPLSDTPPKRPDKLEEGALSMCSPDIK